MDDAGGDDKGGTGLTTAAAGDVDPEKLNMEEKPFAIVAPPAGEDIIDPPPDTSMGFALTAPFNLPPTKLAALPTEGDLATLLTLRAPAFHVSSVIREEDTPGSEP